MQYVVKCMSSEEFLRLKEEFHAALKAENEKRNVLSLDLNNSEYDELKNRGICIRPEQQFSADAL